VLAALLLLFFCASHNRNLRDYSKKPEAQALEFSWSSLIEKIDARRKNMVNKQKE